MVELISKLISLALLLLGWFFGKKEERKQRAKEIAEKFAEVTIEGDSLYDQVWGEMSQRSKVEWDDIPIRNQKED